MFYHTCVAVFWHADVTFHMWAAYRVQEVILAATNESLSVVKRNNSRTYQFDRMANKEKNKMELLNHQFPA